MRTRVTAIAVTLVLVAGVAVGWFLESRNRTPVAPASAGSYRVRVTRDGRELASFDLAALQAIGMKRVTVQGGAEEGPLVRDVLKRAGVSDFSQITVVGLGSRDDGRLVLRAESVDADTVLDVAKRGTVKIAGPQIERADRVRDVIEIQVQ